MKTLLNALTVAVVATLSAPAAAHVVLDRTEATAGSYYKATLRVSHGCEGSATTSVRVLVPAGFQNARPFPKSGWSIDAKKVTLAQPYESHGKRVTEDVQEITWRGGPLPDAWADEFSFVGKLPTQTGPLPFKVLQECENGRIDWTEIPQPGAKNPARPAAMLKVLPAPGEAHHH